MGIVSFNNIFKFSIASLKIFINFLAILLYRGCRYSKKMKLKLSHATLFGIVMILTILALVAVFDSHNYANPPIPNMYSLHSWVGLGAVIIFFCQVSTSTTNAT